MPSSAWKKDVCSRSEEHTSELQSQSNRVCRLLLEKKEPKTEPPTTPDLPFWPMLAPSLCAFAPSMNVWIPRRILPSPCVRNVCFFFYERAAPRSPPFSPPRPFPV